MILSKVRERERFRMGLDGDNVLLHLFDFLFTYIYPVVEEYF